MLFSSQKLMTFKIDLIVADLPYWTFECQWLLYYLIFLSVLESNSGPLWEVLGTACLVKDGAIFLCLRLAVKLQVHERLFTDRENSAPLSVALPTFSELSKGFRVGELFLWCAVDFTPLVATFQWLPVHRLSDCGEGRALLFIRSQRDDACLWCLSCRD